MSLVRKQLLKALTVVLALGMVPALAMAQEEYEAFEAEEEDDRVGFTFGIGAGAGQLYCSGQGCEGMTAAGALDLHLGFMAIPSIAIVGDVWGMVHPGEDVMLTQGIASVGPQVWLADKIWLRAGIGVARTAFNYNEDFDFGDEVEEEDILDRSDVVPAFAAAAGVDFYEGNDFSLGAQLKFGTGFDYEEENTRVQNVSLGLAATWY